MIEVSTNIHLILIKPVLLSDARQDYQDRSVFYGLLLSMFNSNSVTASQFLHVISKFVRNI